jgi:hypothetical protein
MADAGARCCWCGEPTRAASPSPYCPRCLVVKREFDGAAAPAESARLNAKPAAAESAEDGDG